jgi:CheY-like chemotaxis protein
MGGDDVLARLRAVPGMPAMCCIALSANAMPVDVAEARDKGFDDYWTKPIDFDAFLSALDRLAETLPPP